MQRHLWSRVTVLRSGPTGRRSAERVLISSFSFPANSIKRVRHLCARLPACLPVCLCVSLALCLHLTSACLAALGLLAFSCARVDSFLALSPSPLPLPLPPPRPVPSPHTLSVGAGRYLFLNAMTNQLRYPNSHTHYMSCMLLQLFAASHDKEIVREQVLSCCTRPGARFVMIHVSCGSELSLDPYP